MRRLVLKTPTFALWMALWTLWTSSALAQQGPAPTQQGPAPELPPLGQPSSSSASSTTLTPNPAQPAQPLMERLVFVLSGYDYFPTRPQLDALAPTAQLGAALLLIAQDEAATPSLRLRALDAMGYYADHEPLWRHLESLVGQQTPPADLQQLRLWRAMRRHAVLSLARARGAQAAPTLAPLLAADQDFQLQMTAISALGKHGGEPGKRALRALRARGQRQALDPLITQELERYLGRPSP